MRNIGVKYLAVGDSITEGDHLSFHTQRYADLLTTSMAGISTYAFEKNLGLIGFTSEQILPVVTRDFDPDIVTVLIGTNDIGTYTPSQTASNITTLIQTIQGFKRTGNCDIYLCTLLPRFDGVDVSSQNTAIRPLATSLNVTLIELSTVLPNSSYTVDNLHPNASGHQLVANAMWSVIQPRSGIWSAHH